MKRNKSGISLIVLVITIIVMIILAAAVVITLNNTNIINRANEGVAAWDLNQVQNIAALAWAEAYLDKNAGETVNFQDRVETALTENGVNLNKYVVTATETGVEVCEKTLGALIKGPEDYGKTVDYTVTVGSETYDEWQVYYEDEANGYVFLATPDIFQTEVGVKSVADLTNDDLRLYNIFKLGQNITYTLSDSNLSHQRVAALISNYGSYANTAVYGTNVVGAMACPTIELLTAGWNSKGYDPIITATIVDGWYRVNGEISVQVQNRDTIYLLSAADYPHYLTSPTDSAWILVAGRTAHLGVTTGGSGSSGNSYKMEIRPVVCLKSTTPAEEGTTTDFSLIK